MQADLNHPVCNCLALNHHPYVNAQLSLVFFYLAAHLAHPPTLLTPPHTRNLIEAVALAQANPTPSTGQFKNTLVIADVDYFARDLDKVVEVHSIPAGLGYLVK